MHKKGVRHATQGSMGMLFSLLTWMLLTLNAVGWLMGDLTSKVKGCQEGSLEHGHSARTCRSMPTRNNAESDRMRHRRQIEHLRGPDTDAAVETALRTIENVTAQQVTRLPAFRES